MTLRIVCGGGKGKMIEEEKERKLIIAVLEGVVEKAELWHHFKATLSIDTSEAEEIILVVSKR